MKDRYLRIMSIAGVLSVLIVILMGALVTNTGSAYGCGNNWPLCNGQVIPTADKQQTWIEFSHRIVSGIASILTVVQAVWIWIRLKHVRETKFLAIASVFFIFLQAFLGAAAVVWGQSGPVLALHFGISLLSFASMLLIAFIVFEGTGAPARRIAPPIHHGMRWNFILLSIYSYILIYSGAFVRHTGSTLGSTDFPLINGRLFPQPLVSKAGVQYLHRVLAFIILIWLIVTLVVCLKRYKNVPSLSVTLSLSLIFVLLQSVSGIIIIRSHMALYSLILHSLFVTCFFGLLMILLMLSLRKTGGPEHG